METLYHPVFISSRLAAAVKVAGATVSAEPSGRFDRNGKPEWKWYLDFPDGSAHSGGELWSRGDSAETLETLLSFLGACGEGLNYQTRTGRESENSSLFPAAVAEWCAANVDEIALVQFEIEESRKA